MDRELRILLDERAINAVMNEYCHAMDNGENDRWMNCFTADAVYDVALPNGTIYARLDGEADLRKFIQNYPVLPGHKHVYVTPLFDIDPDAGEATVAAYWFMLSGNETKAGISSLGRVQDRFVRGADGRWRMRERRVATEGMAVG
jgi:ketosteroid isomerase-like protein